jgi:hypothetical protein
MLTDAKPERPVHEKRVAKESVLGTPVGGTG